MPKLPFGFPRRVTRGVVRVLLPIFLRPVSPSVAPCHVWNVENFAHRISTVRNSHSFRGNLQSENCLFSLGLYLVGERAYCGRGLKCLVLKWMLPERIERLGCVVWKLFCGVCMSKRWLFKVFGISFVVFGQLHTVFPSLYILCYCKITSRAVSFYARLWTFVKLCFLSNLMNLCPFASEHFSASL